MNGAELVVETAVKAGVEVCFANAGTTEMPIVLALDSKPGIRAILGLFEGVCTGAADGYGRMLDRPAMALLHLGPGLANGIANLHNARRSGTPLLNVIGEHATWHRDADPPLAMDIEALAATASGWQRTNKSPAMLSRDLADAVAAAMYGQISSLIVPSDNLWAAVDEETAAPRFSYDPVDPGQIDEAARAIRSGEKTALIIGGRALREQGMHAAGRIRAASGCDILTDTFPGYVERGAGLPDVTRLPYFPEPAVQMLSQYHSFVFAGAKEPVAFFGYQGAPGRLLEKEQKQVHIASDRQNPTEALESLAQTLNAPAWPKIAGSVSSAHRRPEIPTGELTAEKVCLVLAALQPEDAIVVDEGLTTSFAFYPLGAGLPQHSFLTIAGGSIGYGMPCAAGASVACPDRPVIDFQADGSAMYTLQALWTEAREGLDVTTLICSNRSYSILRIELARAGIFSVGPNASALMDLHHPNIDWVRIAEGMGVPAVSVDTAESLAQELGRSLSEPGPHLIDMVLAPLM